ncbi:DUF3795 domain-containing protein [bacterium]|nr:DUF3795 domain-containing protein [bacterium]
MNQIISYCGISCSECGAYIATSENDDAKRAEVAASWSKMYGADIAPEEINCSGCSKKSGPHFQHCLVCEIRNCALARGVVTCGQCPDYICTALSRFFEMVPDCKTVLDDIRSSL